MFSAKCNAGCMASLKPALLLKTIKRLHKAWYQQSKITPGYWHHDWHPISFTLIVDDFGVKYINKEDVEHLASVLKQDYKININWEGTQYLGLMLD